MEQLRGRVALVTGASGGWGTHTARALAREGMDVAVSGRRQDALAAVAEELRVDVNLTAPLLLTHRAWPRGLHLVGGRQDRFALPAAVCGDEGRADRLDQSLRAEYARAPVGFSVICPGFIAGDGMYQRMVERGVKSNRILGEMNIEKVAARVVRAVRRDLPEVVETGAPIRPMLPLNEMAPRLVARAPGDSGSTRPSGSPPLIAAASSRVTSSPGHSSP